MLQVCSFIYCDYEPCKSSSLHPKLTHEWLDQLRMVRSKKFKMGDIVGMRSW
jgi:hypothetical protein